MSDTFLKDVTTNWQVEAQPDSTVKCHSRMIGGVLCRWWGDGPEPSGVKILDAAVADYSIYPMTITSTRVYQAVFSDAVFSEDRVYRYTLWRKWTDSPALSRKLRYAMFVGLNPSTADETKDDPTVRKCIGFAKRWGYDALCMTNLFAFRATDPRKMKSQSKPIGDENDLWLASIARHAAVVVAAWGVNGGFIGRDEEVLKILDDVQCLRTTKGNFPEHPLYVPYETPLKPYSKI